MDISSLVQSLNVDTKECGICYTKLKIFDTPCNHTFCLDCFSENLLKHGKTRCPNCRLNFYELNNILDWNTDDPIIQLFIGILYTIGAPLITKCNNTKQEQYKAIKWFMKIIDADKALKLPLV